MARTFCRSCSVSRSSRACRSAQRACASRSSQPWQGCARRARRSVASSGSSAAEPRAPFPDRPRCAVAGAAMPVLRSDDARSRRTAGARWLTFLGSRIRPSAVTGVGKSAADRRPAQRSSVSTSGRGSSPLFTPGSRTTASPARRPPGTAMTSPGRSARSASVAASRCSACPCRRSAFSRSPSRAAQRGVLGEVAEVTAHRARVPGEGLGVAFDPPGQPDHRPVRLELAERLLEQLAGRRDAEPADEVDGHVVAGPEGAAQRVGAGRGQAGDLLRVHPGLPDHHGVALDVDAPAPGPPGELGVLAGGQLGVRLAVELDQPLEHDGAGGHVDAQREGLGGEDGPHQPADEQLLDGLLERRQQPRVVGGDPPLERLAPLPVAQHAQVGLRQVTGAALDDAGGSRRPRPRWSAAARRARTGPRRRRSLRG